MNHCVLFAYHLALCMLNSCILHEPVNGQLFGTTSNVCLVICPGFLEPNRTRVPLLVILWLVLKTVRVEFSPEKLCKESGKQTHFL